MPREEGTEMTVPDYHKSARAEPQKIPRCGGAEMRARAGGDRQERLAHYRG